MKNIEPGTGYMHPDTEVYARTDLETSKQRNYESNTLPDIGYNAPRYLVPHHGKASRKPGMG